MGVLKCKMCGGDIHAVEGQSYSTCEYCGSTVTLPKINEDRMENLFNRANHFRMISEFDKAVATYEMILNEDNTQAEAHWGLLLSRFGIEYVQDPATGERIPTCHRIQTSPVLSDDDYLAALEFAPDEYTKVLYEKEAGRLSELQRSLLEVSAKADPFDIFLCYKETADDGSRTVDSTLAQDLYYQLTNAGYKVFFSKITLESLLGREYEPYIFAALTSARVMLVVGTKPEYFSAVWVRNEWSRFLALTKTDKTKTLIPCYRDMNVYDMPDELSMLQSLDMSKIGFMQDLLRGVEKIIHTKKPKETEKAAPANEAAVAAPGVASLQKRAMLFLEDGKFEQADEYFNRVLDIDPEHAPAYIGKLMIFLKVKTEAELIHSNAGFENHPDYKKALRFASPEQKKTYESYLYQNQQHLMEEAQKKQYAQATEAMNTARTPKAFEDAAALFLKLQDYRDCAELAHKCRKQSKKLAQKEKHAEQERLKAKKRIKTFRKCFLILIILISAIAAGGVFVNNQYIVPGRKYKQATELLNNKSYEEAIRIFRELGDYKDSKTQINNSLYQQAMDLYNQKSYSEANEILKSLSGYKDAESYILEYIDKSKVIEIAAGGYHTVGLKADSTVVCVGFNGDDLCNTGGWTDIIAVAAGGYHTVGLKADGTVVCVGNNGNGQCNTDGWTDIIAVAAGGYHTIGLKADSTVICVGDNDDGQCNTNGWTDIIAVAAGDYHTVGLKADGTVVCIGNNGNGRCDTDGWTDIIAVAAGGYHTIGLKADGTVICVGDNDDGQCNTNGWTEIIAVAAGDCHTVGLKADDTVVCVGSNDEHSINYGQCNTEGWTEIIAVAAGGSHTVGLKADGTVVCVGNDYYDQCSTDGWYLER